MRSTLGTGADPLPTRLRQTLGARIHQLRLDRDLTLEAVASRSGCSLGTLSEIERGLGNPSFTTLVKIAHALSVSVGRLVEIDEDAEPPVSPVVRKDRRRRLNPHNVVPGDGTTYELLTPDLNRALEVLHLTVRPGTSTEATPFVHEGEEVGYILKGVQEVHVDGVTHTLEAGDSIAYSSSVPHWYRNPSAEVLEAIWIITPPTF